MASITKFTGFYICPNEDPEVAVCILDEIFEHATDRYWDGFFHHIRTSGADIGEWADDHPLNYKDVDLAECEKYFVRPSCRYRFDRPIPVAGEKYRHFKQGKPVTIIAVGRDSENPDAECVVYQCPNGVYIRPLDMFMSEVDRRKYPNAEQKYRFEKVSE